MSLTPEFNQVEVDLKGNPLNNPTSIQFGPDGRLYVSQQDGLIRSYNLKAITDADGFITKLVINNKGGADKNELVKNIPNHDDDGDLNTAITNRQVTGLVVEEGANGETVLYVSSSDPRIGGGNSGSEKNLDTNSGIISRLTKTGNSWEKVDLVIGLPRSEENHSTNGLDIRTEMVDGKPHKVMYVVSGGNTNKGAPSNNFAWTPEYYYSAAVLRIDLTQLEQIEANEGLKGGSDYVDPYVYALPTLNDPTRPDNAQGQDTAAGTTGAVDAEAADTFGGNDGRNQAKYDPNGPVQVYSMGYRNAYDIVITEDDNIYTFDNGPNNGWGDVPLEADGSTPVNSRSQVATNHPNIDVNTGNDTDPDNLHLVTPDFYAGHPNPIYASGAAAGLYWVDTSSGSPVVKQLTDPSDPNNDPTTLEDDLPSDWDEIAGGLTHPEAGVYLSPGTNPYGTDKGADGSLVTINSSSNGLAEYIAGKEQGSYPVTDVPGAEVVVTVAFNGNIYFMEIVGDGTQEGTDLTDISPIFVGGTPLDVRDVEAFAIGTEQFKDAIVIAQFGTDSLTALVPGVPAAPDVDQDDDGLEDNVDPLQYDPVNGTNTPLNAGDILFWDFNPADSGVHPGPSGEYNIGMTGWMTNGTEYLDGLTNLNNTIRGGAPGIFQVKSVGGGDLEGSGNDQQDAIQTGFLPGADVNKFTIEVPLFNPFTSDANASVAFSESASMGVSLGDGTMSNWIGITVEADNSAGSSVQPQIKLTYEENDSLIRNLSVNAPELLNAVDNDRIELQLTVDMETFEVTPSWRYETAGAWSDTQLVSAPVQLDSGGSIVQALQGQNTINSIQSAPVVSLISTSTGSQPFTADFLDLTVMDVVDSDVPQVVLVETNGLTEVAEGGFTDDYALVLSTQPTSDVTVTLSPDAQVSLDKTEVVFTTTNWNEPQQVAIAAADDSVDEGNHTGRIVHEISTDDNNYAQVSVPSLPVNIVDNDKPTILHRINVGGQQVAAADGSTLDWSEDTSTNPSSFRIGSGGAKTYTTSSAIDLSAPSLTGSAPEAVFQSERWDPSSGEKMQWEFPVDSGSDVEVRLYFAEIYKPIVAPDQRVFDVSVEGAVPTVFNDIDPYETAGYGGFMLSHSLTMEDNVLDIDFSHVIQNPALKGIEILSSQVLDEVAPTITTGNSVTVPENQTAVLDINATDDNGDTEGNGLTYQPLSGPDGAFFTIAPDTGVLSFKDAPDFENPLDNDSDNVYQLEVMVKDSTGLTDLQTLSVSVSDVNENESAEELLYRINVGGPAVAAADGSTAWSADTSTNPSSYRAGSGGAKTYTTNAAIDISGLSVPASASEAVFKSERYDPASGSTMQWEFPVAPDGDYEVRLLFAETYSKIQSSGKRVFDVAVEGSVPAAFSDIDPFAIAGQNAGFALSHTATVGDNSLSLEFLNNIQSPALKGIEIFAVDGTVAV